MVACFAQRVRQLFILRDCLSELSLGLEESLLQRPDAFGGVLDPPPERSDLVFEQLRLCTQFVKLGFGVPRSLFEVVCVDRINLLLFAVALSGTLHAHVYPSVFPTR